MLSCQSPHCWENQCTRHVRILTCGTSWLWHDRPCHEEAAWCSQYQTYPCYMRPGLGGHRVKHGGQAPAPGLRHEVPVCWPGSARSSRTAPTDPAACRALPAPPSHALQPTSAPPPVPPQTCLPHSQGMLPDRISTGLPQALLAPCTAPCMAAAAQPMSDPLSPEQSAQRRDVPCLT